jgi:hypothetical protein
VTSPSTSTGTSPRGFAAANSPATLPEPIAAGSSASNGTPFSASAILTFCA